MLLNIVLLNSNEKVEAIRDQLHTSLAGNNDYVTSNIILGDDGCDTCDLFFSGDKCKDKEYIREKAKLAIDLFVDSL